MNKKRQQNLVFPGRKSLGAGTLILVSVLALFPLLTACSRPAETQDNLDSQATEEASTLTESVTPVEEPALYVEGITVSRGRLVDRLNVSGIVQGIREARVVSETQGIIRQVNVVPGQAVQADTILVQVDGTVAGLNLEQARIQWESARTDLSAAERFSSSGSASQADLARARAAVSGAEARYEQARKAYDDTRIRPPFPGFVATLESGIGVGNYVTPGVPVARITDLSRLRMEVGLGEREIRYVQVGDQVELSIAGFEQTFQARIESVAAGSDPRTGSFPVRIVWDNPLADQIRSGVNARGVIRVSRTQEALLVPSYALVQQNNENFVYVENEGLAQRRLVEVGLILGNRAEVLSGLEVGDEVIVSALSSLQEGRTVQVSNFGRSNQIQ